MKCPYCGHIEDKVVDSRSTREDSATRRRRECLSCAKRYTTYEYVELPLVVSKVDGSRESFSREKLKRGVEIALVKRPVSTESITKLVAEIEEACQKLEHQEISAVEIGEMVMQKLRDIDEVAYIRFASVYRRFEDVGEFRRELDKM